MRTLFFGDSFTRGENNGDISFVDYLGLGMTYNYSESGTTMGEYSIYPVDGCSLLSKIATHQEIIKTSDTIFIEYGINDISSVMAGFVLTKVVIISFVKAIDAIKQLNPDAKIYFLTLSTQSYIIQQIAKYQCDYLKNIYFSGFDIDVNDRLWYNNYQSLMNIISKKCKLIPMFESIDEVINNMSDDNIHPNDEGQRIIAQNIKKYI